MKIELVKSMPVLVGAVQTRDLECGGRAQPDEATQGEVVAKRRHRFGSARSAPKPLFFRSLGFPSPSSAKKGHEGAKG